MSFEIIIIDKPISFGELSKLAEQGFGDMVKAVVDTKREIMAIGAEMHADEETFLLEQGSDQEDLWGINLYTVDEVDEWLEFDSMINIRPNQNNRSRYVEDERIRNVVTKIVDKLINR